MSVQMAIERAIIASNGSNNETRWYPWGIQSPHTLTAMGGGVLGKLRFADLNSGKKVRVFHFRGRGVFWVSSDLNSGKKVRVFHFGGGGCSG